MPYSEENRMYLPQRLRDAFAAAGLPSPDGISCGLPGDVTGWRIDWPTGTTDQQRQQGLSILTNFDFSDQAHKDWLDSLKPERKTLADQAQAAINKLVTYKALASPTAAQRKAFEDGVCDILTAIINRLVKIS